MQDTDLPIFFAQQADPIAADQAVFGAAQPDDEGAFLVKWARIRANPDTLTRTIEADGGVAGYAHAPRLDRLVDELIFRLDADVVHNQ
ncbi:hypothetical protein [Nitrospirillum sp. BR 11828]|uniref:hypothetical protein n=1 Tax=Nitrospirillum sp. BR 11828 TaxID=3104325 RepID=UPI002ACA3246|nr:hypothetical protein [Nitrospirillum sp. BR 11828]MDZ5645921.1 hypothetical protein [Nitrospirillum sp. BR 11828]